MRHCLALLAISRGLRHHSAEPGASGKAVIAYRAGGFLDTIQEGKTGVFISDPRWSGRRRLWRSSTRRTGTPAPSVSTWMFLGGSFISRLKDLRAGFARRLKELAHRRRRGGQTKKSDRPAFFTYSPLSSYREALESPRGSWRAARE